jgi:pimeloyl-ACP methyl ester carboxylesterase
MYAGAYPESTSSIVLFNAAPPVSPELQKAFGREFAAGRAPDDNAAKKAIEDSPLFRASGRAGHWAAQRHQRI